MGTWVKLAGMVLVSLVCGCVHTPCYETLPEMPFEVQAAHALPQTVKNRVHVVLVGGMLDHVGLKPMRADLLSFGFIKTYSGVAGTKSSLQKLLAETRRKEPDARFALVGHSGGACLAADLANELASDGATVDLLMLIEPLGTPAGFGGHTLHLTTTGKVLDGAENLRLDASTLDASTHPGTKALLLRELVSIGSRVGVVSTGPVVAPYQALSEWDFIHPERTPSTIPCDKPILHAGRED